MKKMWVMTRRERRAPGIQLETRRPRLLRRKKRIENEPGAVAARQSAAKPTGAFQMAAFL
jgi:hypothetical protein